MVLVSALAILYLLKLTRADGAQGPLLPADRFSDFACKAVETSPSRHDCEQAIDKLLKPAGSSSHQHGSFRQGALRTIGTPQS